MAAGWQTIESLGKCLLGEAGEARKGCWSPRFLWGMYGTDPGTWNEWLFWNTARWIKHVRALHCASCLQLLKCLKYKEYFGDQTGMTHTGREQQAAGKPSTYLSLWKWLETYCEKWDELNSFSSMEDVKKKTPHLYSKPVIQNSNSRFLWRD